MAIRSGGQAPYAPPQTVLALLRAYRNRGLQTPFTSDVLMRAGVPGSLVPRTLQSLRLLDMIDEDGNPSQELEGLRRAAQSDYPERLAAILRTAYAEVFQYVDPAEDDETKVRDAFRAFEPLGQLTRMVRLFLALCAEANLIPEEKKKPVPNASLRAARAREKASAPAKKGQQSNAARPPTQRADTVGSIPSPIAGLLSALPHNGRGWTKDQRDRFVKTFESVLDFSIPIRAEDMGDEDDADAE